LLKVDEPANNPAASRERKIVLLLCLLAAVHVFIFSAAFPFFNNVDEQAHIDLVVRYSQGNLPRALSPLCAEAQPFFIVYGTPQYIWPPDSQPGGLYPPPPWKQSFTNEAPLLMTRESAWKNVVNHEASQPPLYYAIAGIWWRAGKILGLDGGFLLYWLRFLNIPFIVTLVWLGWHAARRIFPENNFIRAAVPAFITFMPQTAFYAINNDILSPLAFGAAFMLLLKITETDAPGARPAAATGLMLAATFLTKISNLPLLAVAGIFLLLKIFRLAQDGKLRASVLSLAILAACAGLPAAAWMAWCRSNFGDFTGSESKIQFLGWTKKPLTEWFHHPIFTPHGLWYFTGNNFSTFWQGEFIWQGKPLAFSAVDLFYVLLTLALLLFAFVALLRRPVQFSPPQRQALWFSLACFAAAVTFFGFLSIIYDFHGCFYPSREHPYFTSGRLMLGALIPFLLVFVSGLDRALKKFGNAAKFSAMAGIILFMLVMEVTIDRPIFQNPYNWFHM
jgi:hypothetical protein